MLIPRYVRETFINVCLRMINHHWHAPKCSSRTHKGRMGEYNASLRRHSNQPPNGIRERRFPWPRLALCPRRGGWVKLQKRITRAAQVI